MILNFKKEARHPVAKQKWTLGQKAADKLTILVGSWTFIILLAIFLIAWMSVNILMLLYRWDPYPFILLNLILSCLAAVQAPIILMTQKRSSQKDRLRSEYDYQVNRRAEKEIREIKNQLERIEKKLKK